MFKGHVLPYYLLLLWICQPILSARPITHPLHVALQPSSNSSWRKIYTLELGQVNNFTYGSKDFFCSKYGIRQIPLALRIYIIAQSDFTFIVHFRNTLTNLHPEDIPIKDSSLAPVSYFKNKMQSPPKRHHSLPFSALLCSAPHRVTELDSSAWPSGSRRSITADFFSLLTTYSVFFVFFLKTHTFIFSILHIGNVCIFKARVNKKIYSYLIINISQRYLFIISTAQ